MNTQLKLRNVRVGKRRTSIRLEDAFWRALQHVAGKMSVTVDEVCTSLDQNRQGSLSSELRVFVLTSVIREAEGNGRSVGVVGHAGINPAITA